MVFHEAQKLLTKARENDEFRLVEEMCELEALGNVSGYFHSSLGEVHAMEVIGEEQDLTTGSRAAKSAELEQIILEQDLLLNVSDIKRTSIENNYATKRRGVGHSSYKKTQNLTKFKNPKKWMRKCFFGNKSQKLGKLKVVEVKVASKLACMKCGRMFGHKSRLESHMAIHEVIVKSHCCNEYFTTKYELNKHNRRYHHRYIPLWSCQYSSCVMSFDESSLLSQHMVCDHFGPIADNVMKYKCSACLTTFTKKKTARSHSFKCSGLAKASLMAINPEMLTPVDMLREAAESDSEGDAKEMTDSKNVKGDMKEQVLEGKHQVEDMQLQLGKSTYGLETKLSEVSANLEEETRQKFAVDSKLTAMENEKKLQQFMKEIQRDDEEAHAIKNEVLQQSKDLEKKIKSLEADLVQIQEDLSAAERARRTAESERDELAEELSTNGSKGALAIDEKRRLEFIIAALEGELEEEQTQVKMLMERARKAQISTEQLTTELTAERGNAQKMENSKLMLERQNKELKVKLEEVENSNRAKAKAAIGKFRVFTRAERQLLMSL